MKTEKTTILIVPGHSDSGPNHWQSIWLSQFPNAIRVIQKDWVDIERDAWVEALDEAIRSAEGSIVLVGHSIGCSTIIEWAKGKGKKSVKKIKGALLVAPPDTHSEAYLALKVKGFSAPFKPLSFPTLLVISTNDPFLSVEKGRAFGESLACPCISVGNRGHLGEDSNVGEWSIGKEFLKTLLD